MDPQHITEKGGQVMRRVSLLTGILLMLAACLAPLPGNRRTVTYAQPQSSRPQTEEQETGGAPSLRTLQSADLFWSEYDPLKFYSSAVPYNGMVTSDIQYRMNCYGYAMRFLLQGPATVTVFGSFIYAYGQDPGDFVSYSRMNDAVNLGYCTTPAQMIGAVETNMLLDAERLGYSVVRYYPAGTSVPDISGDARLIALVTGNYYGVLDYHFYMQHPDGTWSHKPGCGPVLNTSLSTGILLTNDNIQVLANESHYTNGEIRFYVVTRDAVYDHPHAPYIASVQTAVYDAEVAGDYFACARPVTVDDGFYDGYWDFSSDRDLFSFVAVSTEINFEAWCNCEFSLILFDSSRMMIGFEDGPNGVLQRFFTGPTLDDTLFPQSL